MADSAWAKGKVTQNGQWAAGGPGSVEVVCWTAVVSDSELFPNYHGNSTKQEARGSEAVFPWGWCFTCSKTDQPARMSQLQGRLDQDGPRVGACLMQSYQQFENQGGCSFPSRCL